MIFAETLTDNSVSLAALGVLATCVASMVWVVRYSLTKGSRDLEEHTKAAIELKNYLVDRNGRDAEAHKENMAVQRKLTASVNELPKVIQQIADDATEKIINKQTVHEQNVEHQIVKERK